MPTITEIAESIARQAASAQALVESAQRQAMRAADLNPIAYVDWPAALDEARALDAHAKAGHRRGPLHGIPVSIKDLFAVRGMPTKAGTRASLPSLGCDEAVVVTRLREAGALVFAKTNMHEIALGATGENRWTGDVKNPFDPARQSGGSSSGAAVAVATGIGMAAIGSDTGGSVRVPAAFCGITGFKPSHGAIPLDGALPLSWTCDHAGPLARCVDDCAALFEVMARRRVTHGAVGRRPRLAVPASWLAGRLQPAVREAFARVHESLMQERAELSDVATSALALAWRCYTPIVRAEAAWVHREALEGGGAGFSDAVLAALTAGRALAAGDYIDALKLRERVRGELDALLAGFDALILPTTAVLPPRRGQDEIDVEGGRMSVREAVLGQTLPFSLCGLPTLTIPVGMVDGLPLGLQAVGRRGADAALLAIGRWLEATVGVTPMPPEDC